MGKSDTKLRENGGAPNRAMIVKDKRVSTKYVRRKFIAE
jgi:hypothetical protein